MKQLLVANDHNLALQENLFSASLIQDWLICKKYEVAWSKYDYIDKKRNINATILCK